MSERARASTSTAINNDYASNVVQQAAGKFWALVIFITLPDEDAFHLPIFTCVSYDSLYDANEAFQTRAHRRQLDRIYPTTKHKWTSIFTGHYWR